MDFTGVKLSYVKGRDGKYGVVVQIPSHLRVVSITHKKPGNICDPLDCVEGVGINLEEIPCSSKS